MREELKEISKVGGDGDGSGSARGYHGGNVATGGGDTVSNFMEGASARQKRMSGE